MARGYFGIGIYHPKREENVGGLFRSAYSFGASFIFTIGQRYKLQSSDTCNTPGQIPLYEYLDYAQFCKHIPRSCPVIGIELTENAGDVRQFSHPKNCIYLLGAEDHGLPKGIIEECNYVIQIPGLKACLNVASTGSIICYDRYVKTQK